MDPKAPVSSLALFKETRADLEPLTSGSVIQIQIPSTSSFTARPRQQRRILKNTTGHRDEYTFTKCCIATSGSLYFGKFKRHPRSFLWRVLQEGKVLELRSVDLSKSSGETREASYIIQFCFPAGLKHGGIALADSEDQEALNVFALTRGNELYTFTLRKDFFCLATASEEEVSRWCKASKPATFSISTPHSLIAASFRQLIVSLSDGRILRLTRNKDEDGSKWKEATYGDGQWASSLRGLVRWQGSNTVKFDGTTLEQATPIAMARSPDKKHVFAVCLNHTLRIWNLNKAASVFSMDLLWKHREPHDIPKVTLEPSSPNVLQLFRIDEIINGCEYYAVTFSPHDFGQFKFWGIRDPDHGAKGVRDLFPEYCLKPPDPDPSPESKAIWKVADFKITGGQHGKSLDMWILMRSNRQYKLYNLKFDIQDLANVWHDSWSTTASETLGDSEPPLISDLDPEDATDKWLEYVFYPCRYPETILETALGMYCSERSVSLPNPKAPLKERMNSAIVTHVSSVNAASDFSTHRAAINLEWTVLWQDIRDLNKSRWEVLSLACDEYAQMPWVAFADGYSAIRSCDKIENISQNSSAELAVSNNLLPTPSIEADPGAEPRLPDELAVIIEAATSFRQSFSYQLRSTCDRVLANELWLDPSYSVPLRIQSFYDQCNFTDEIGSAPFDDLMGALDRIGGFNGLETDTFLAVLDELSHGLPEHASDLVHTRFGLKLLINGAQEMIALRVRLLFDLLVLVVFVDMEIDREEMPMENFDAPRIYVDVLELLKQYQIIQWLAKNTRVEKSDLSAKPTLANSSKIDISSDSKPRISTILESLFALDLPAQSLEMQSQSEALTQSIQDLLLWATGGHDPTVTFDDVPVYVQCNLLAKNILDLASDFLRFQPSTAWATYIKGRLSLLKGEFTEAAIYFKKAAFKLSRPSNFDYHHASHSLLTPMESIHFGHGLPTYYTHLLNLFDAHSCPTQMAHFAHLALQLTPVSQTKNQSTTITLLTSLFQASLQTTDFPTAYSALTRHPSPSTLLPSLIQAIMSTPNALPQLLALPFPVNLHEKIDALLVEQKKPKILAAWRLHHQDFRGAAAALLPPLRAAQARAKRGDDGLENQYLTVINLLACAGEGKGWVLSEDVDGGKGKRKIVEVKDVRALYQRELDRRSVIEGGRFGFVGGGGGDEMDVL